MARRIVLALLFTLALAFVALRSSQGNPKDVYIEDGDVKAWHRTVTEVIIRTIDGRVLNVQPRIEVRVDGPAYLRKMVEFKSEENPVLEKRRLIPVDKDKYFTHLPPCSKGKSMWYAIVLMRQDGSIVRIPSGSDFYEVRFKGEVSRAVLIAHAVIMFVAFFFMILSFIGALAILRNKEGKKPTVSAARLALASLFLGAVLLGFILNMQAFGVLWEAFPFGDDITDNKTQLVMIFWLVSLLLVRGSAFWGGETRDKLGSKGFAWAVILSFVASLALYLIPHSLRIAR